MAINKFSLVFLVGCVCLFQEISCGLSQQHPQNMLWFPNPNTEDGSLIPAYLEPSPRRIEFNESFIHFYLYTTQSPSTRKELIIGDADSLAQSNIIRGAPLKIMSHGFGGSANSGFPQRAKNEYLRSAIALNVIAIDWEALAESPYYFEAAANTKTVGRKAAQLLEWLISEQVVTRNQIHVMGFSLGAQVAGIIGSNMDRIPPRITALDPARPLFDVANLTDRVDPSDAEFVEVIHTAGLTLAFLDPQGHCDFYPNGGATQPGCGTDVTGSCAHGRAPAYLEESIVNPFGFKGVLCANVDDYNANLCSNNHIQYMGALTATTSRGKYFLTTNSESPFARG